MATVVNFVPDTADLAIPVTEVKNLVLTASQDADKQQASGVAQFTRGCSIKMRRSNTGVVYVGGPNVNATNGYELAAGESLQIQTNDLSLVWLVFEKNGDKAAILFGK